jgi:hypothetical protein
MTALPPSQTGGDAQHRAVRLRDVRSFVSEARHCGLLHGCCHRCGIWRVALSRNLMVGCLACCASWMWYSVGCQRRHAPSRAGPRGLPGKKLAHAPWWHTTSRGPFASKNMKSCRTRRRLAKGNLIAAAIHTVSLFEFASRCFPVKTHKKQNRNQKKIDGKE